MKKRLLFVAAIFAATATFAQDGLTSKKGEAYLPEAGDWSIGFDASALTGFVGNAFNGTVGNAALTSGGWMNGSVNQELRAKMFKDETTAYRLRARIGVGSNSNEVLGKFDSDADPLTADVDYAVTTTNSNGFDLVLGAGLEKRRGATRIQGYYGGEIFFGFGTGASTKIDDDRTLSDNYMPAARTTETKFGSTFTLGLQGFVGVEWFFAPKVSLGAEYTWGLGMTANGEGETTTEEWGTAFGAAPGTANSLQTVVTKTGKSGSFSFDTGHIAAININFHF